MLKKLMSILREIDFELTMMRIYLKEISDDVNDIRLILKSQNGGDGDV